MPLPYLSMLKTAYDVVKQAIGFVEQVQEKYKETVAVSSDVMLYRPGKEEIVERILLGKFPSIPGRYRMRVKDGQDQVIDVRATINNQTITVTWRYKELGDESWWLLTDEIIKSIHWIELIEIYYE